MAVYTEVSDEELDAFIEAYDVGRVLSCKGIAEGVENSNFLVVTEGGTFILTLYEKRVKESDLPFFLDLMHHLSAHGITCPLPVVPRDGQPLRRLAGKPAAMVTFLTGQWPRRIEPFHCAELGQTLARMHDAVGDFAPARANALGLEGWRALAASDAPRADEVQPALGRRIEEEVTYLSAHWPQALPHGVIHADLFPDNVFFRDKHLSGVIDFYFACTDAFAYDLMICLNAWCFERDHAFNVTKARALLSAYDRARPLSEAEKAALPLLARGSALRFLLTRLHDWLNTPPGALVKRKDPLEYLAKLRFHQSVKSAADYGLYAS
jgi:homoserine kinase type II